MRRSQSCPALHSVDLTLNARLRGGLTLQAGTSTGRSVEDDCATQVLIDSSDPRNCRDVDPFQTTLRGLATYTIPRVDVLVSATLRSQPPNERVANWNVVVGLLGRLPVGATPTGTTTIALLDTDHRLYEDTRRTQIDMRFAKVFRFRGTRADVGVDVGNLLNVNYATAYQNTYQYSVDNAAMGGTWSNPTAVYTPRFVRLNFTVNF